MWEGLVSVRVGVDRDKLRVIMNMVINIWFPQNAEKMLASQEGLFFHGVSPTLDENKHCGFPITF
jgi:hypothetical protein